MARLDNKVYAFLDTNIFLEYQEFTQVNWQEVTNSKKVCLVITRANTQELDDFKYDPKSQRRQSRSRNTIKKIREIWRTSGATGEVQVPQRPGVTLLLLTAMPDLSTYPEMRQGVPDDQMIASILDFKKVHSAVPADNIVLVTGDIGPEVLALHLGIPVIALDEQYLLDPEPNETEKRLRQLERKFTELQELQPKPNILVKDVIDNVLNIDQIVRNAGLEEVLKASLPVLKQSVQRVEYFYNQSARTSSRRSGPIPLSQLEFRRDLEIPNHVSRGVRHYASINNLEVDRLWLMPVDVYSRSLPAPYAEEEPEGLDWRWYNAVKDLYNTFLEDARSRFLAAAQSAHFPLTVEVSNQGSVGMKEASIEILSEDVALSYILPSFEEPQSPREQAPPIFRALVSDERSEAYQLTRLLQHRIPLLRPKQQVTIDVGYLKLSTEAKSRVLRLRVSAENLADPVEKQFTVDINDLVVDRSSEAEGWRKIFVLDE